MERKKLAVLFGGCSPEHSVSLESAHAVIAHIDRDKYEVFPIGITREGQWYHYLGDIDNILKDTWWNDKDNLISAIISPDREVGGLIEFLGNEARTSKLDGVLPILHGRNGEDGRVQGLVELAGIPLIGCNTLSSALSMDKDRAHKVVQAAGIEVPKGVVISKNTKKNTIYALIDSLKYPIFVKPVNAGSSYGISKLHEKEGLTDAVDLALEFDNEVIIEENIEGNEVGCAVLGDEEVIIGRVDEIDLYGDFLDYEDKYDCRKSTVHMPARLDEETENRIKNAGEIIYKALGCSGFARVDMFLTPDNRIVFNEINTIPGFTSMSRYPNMLKGIGMSYEAIVNKLIELGMDQ